MYKIVNKRNLNTNTKLFEIYAPKIAQKAQAGQFIIFRADKNDKRVPLTIADFNPKKGTVTIVAIEIGVSTKKLGRMNIGDALHDFVGPLGNPTYIEKFGTVVCVSGGTGTAAIYPIVYSMKKAGNKVITIIGVRNKNLLFYDKEIEKIADKSYISSDDGSIGKKGLVTESLKKVLEAGEKVDLVINIGPAIMMKAVAETTSPYEIKTISSLNPIMIDGTGMCGGCRVLVDGKIRFACVDGPEFNAHKVDFDNLISRLKIFNEQEKIMNKHICCISLDK